MKTQNLGGTLFVQVARKQTEMYFVCSSFESLLNIITSSNRQCKWLIRQGCLVVSKHFRVNIFWNVIKYIPFRSYQNLNSKCIYGHFEGDLRKFFLILIFIFGVSILFILKIIVKYVRKEAIKQ